MSEEHNEIEDEKIVEDESTTILPNLFEKPTFGQAEINEDEKEEEEEEKEQMSSAKIMKNNLAYCRLMVEGFCELDNQAKQFTLGEDDDNLVRFAVPKEKREIVISVWANSLTSQGIVKSIDNSFMFFIVTMYAPTWMRLLSHKRKLKRAKAENEKRAQEETKIFKTEDTGPGNVPFKKPSSQNSSNSPKTKLQILKEIKSKNE